MSDATLVYRAEKNTSGTIRFKQTGWPMVNGSFYIPKPILKEAGVEVPETPEDDKAKFAPEHLPEVGLRVTYEIVPQSELD